jgi:hypothetical protein
MCRLQNLGDKKSAPAARWQSRYVLVHVHVPAHHGHPHSTGLVTSACSSARYLLDLPEVLAGGEGYLNTCGARQHGTEHPTLGGSHE